MMTKNLKINIIQAPMAGGIVSPEMVVDISNSGMLGMIASGYLSFGDLENFIIEVKSLLNADAIFGVNLFIEPHLDRPIHLPKNKEILDAEKLFIKTESNELNFTVPINIAEKDYVELLIKHQVPIVSTTFGLLSKKSINQLQQNSIEVIATVTSIAEAQLAIDKSIKTIIFQGVEAGGHQATFINNKINTTSTMTLIKEAKNKFGDGTNIIASGGISINNARDYFDNGANYVQMGSVFMMSKSSNLSNEAKKYIEGNFDKNTASKKTTGKYARGIIAKFDEMKSTPYNFPDQHYHTANLRKLAKQNNYFEYASLWVGANRDNLKTYDLAKLIKLCRESL